MQSRLDGDVNKEEVEKEIIGVMRVKKRDKKYQVDNRVRGLNSLNITFGDLSPPKSLKSARKTSHGIG